MTASAKDKARFIENNLGLVHSCAKRFKGRGVEYEDLFQSGCMGLIKAFDAFDESRGFMFSTYAVPVILGEIKKVFRDGGTVKVSRRLRELSLKAAREAQEFAKKHAREPSITELAAILGADEQTLVEALCSARPAISLTVEDDEQTKELDVSFEGPERSIVERLSLHSAVEELSKEEKLLVELRFKKSLTQTDAARIIGSSQVQVSRMERKIIRKLRENLTK